MPLHESVSLLLIEQSSRTQHMLGMLQSGLEHMREENRTGRAAIHQRIDNAKRELGERIERIEKRETPKGRDWSWIKALPWEKVVPIVVLVIASMWVHLTADDWKAIILAKYGGKP